MPPYLAPWTQYGSLLGYTTLTALALLVFIPFMIGWFIVGVDFLMVFIWPIFFWKPKNKEDEDEDKDQIAS